jgi:ATP-dependent exoDNAse (exonuclease V) beta subunit
MSGGISFRGLVEELAAQSEKEEASEAPVLEEDSDGVRLMTVHGAKGLEFPVVILADLTANLAAREPDQFVDGERRLSATRLLRCAPRELAENEPQENARERAEGVRVAYVAATRARDLLVIPAIGDGPFDGWLSPLNKSIYPSQLDWRRSLPAPGCPPFGQATVVERPADYDREDEFSVRPGLIRPERGEHEVVWWDPSKLNLNVEGGLGLRQQEILAEDGGASLAVYRSWQSERDVLLTQGARPEFQIFLPSQATDVPPGELISVETLAVSKAEGRPAGRRFGTLVHAVLRDVQLDASAESIRKLAALHARSIGAPAEESEAARVAVEHALGHPLMVVARAASRCHREYPLTLRLEDGRLLEGVIDMAYVEAGVWTIIDFKTDADVGDRRASYERQLQWYAYALAQLSGMSARAFLLSV